MKNQHFLLAAIFSTFMLANCSNGSPGEAPDGEYETKPDVEAQLKSCIDYLKAENWDGAVECYDGAYDKDGNDPNAIIYSALANLAKISTDQKLATLLKDHLGFTEYPNKLNALFSSSWLKKYPEYIMDYYYDSSIDEYVEWIEKDSWDAGYYEGISEDGYYTCDWSNRECTLIFNEPKYRYTSLPEIKTPEWVKGEGSLYNDMLLNGTIIGADAWALSLIANIIEKNTSGVNTLLDDVVSGVFGASYDKAVERVKRLETRKNAVISLDPYFIEKLGLESIFDEYDKIGWAEVNVITSAMLLTKASLEWVQSYNLDNDLTALKYSWKADGDDILERFKAIDKANLPFNNNFLKVRSGKIDKSKEDFINAIKGLQASYTAIQSSELYSGKVKEAYGTINDGFSEMLKAINNKGKFYIPEDDPTTINSWPKKDGKDVAATIDFGKFFTEGYLSLDKIFETTENGKPVFYLHGQKLTSASPIDQGGRLQLKVNVSHIKGLFGTDEMDEAEFLDIGVSGDAAKELFGKYYN
jgi:hypothetical protein